MLAEVFQADLHQREQLLTEHDPKSGAVKKTLHKVFNAAEVVLKSAEIRAVRAFFKEPQKALFSTSTEYDEPDAPALPDSDPEPFRSEWRDLDDFVEVDWSPSDSDPRIWLIPSGFIPRVTYLKRAQSGPNASGTSRFGNEDSHMCLQGREDCQYCPLLFPSSSPNLIHSGSNDTTAVYGGSSEYPSERS